jgi:hypothetical protein
MQRTLVRLAEIEDLHELRLTVFLLAKILGNQNRWTNVATDEMALATGFTLTIIRQNMRRVLQRGIISPKHISDQPGGFLYRIAWEKPRSAPAKTALDEVEYYFVNTGFLDLLPLARQIARELRLGKEEIIEAIGKLTDKSREYPRLPQEVSPDRPWRTMRFCWR